MKTPKKPLLYKKWEGSTKEERIAFLQQMMKDDHSFDSAAEALRTTPGTIAGFCYRSGIHPKKNKSGPPKEVALAPDSPPPPDAPSPEGPDEEPAQPSSRPRLPPLKMAASEATQCEHRASDGLQCGYERQAQSRFCRLHEPS